MFFSFPTFWVVEELVGERGFSFSFYPSWEHFLPISLTHFRFREFCQERECVALFSFAFCFLAHWENWGDGFVSSSYTLSPPFFSSFCFLLLLLFGFPRFCLANGKKSGIGDLVLRERLRGLVKEPNFGLPTLTRFWVCFDELIDFSQTWLTLFRVFFSTGICVRHFDDVWCRGYRVIYFSRSYELPLI